MNTRHITTAEEVARVLKCGKSTVYALAKNGRIPYLSIGDRGIRFDLEAVLAALSRT
jgi:excisionase family DNA binding protein